jgi:Arc/MetJ-type ribon-helix-helix transcriptional regulator
MRTDRFSNRRPRYRRERPRGHEELVEFIDRLVDEGRAPSRAAVVSRALHRERRREIAARDAAILAAAGAETDEDDLDALARHAASVPMDDLD